MTTDARRQPAPAQDLFTRFIDGGGTIASVKHRQRVIVAFQRSFTDLKGWADAPLPDKLAAPVDIRSFVAWAVLAGPFPAGTDYVGAVRSDWGHHAHYLPPGNVWAGQ